MAADTINKTLETVIHPLEPLTREEIKAVAAIVREGMAELGDSLRFEMIELLEPPKAQVRAFKAGDPITREARVNLFCTGDIGVWRLTVSLDKREVLTKEHVPDARPMIQLEEFLEIENAVKEDPRFIEAAPNAA